MNDAQLLRYSRHILLNELGDLGQQQLLDSHAVVIGAGGLGCSAALFLASSGMGHITLVDHDEVDLTNLQRQIGHNTERIGQAKVNSARQAMLDLNPDTWVTALQQKADAALLDKLLPTAQVVLDCSDNFQTRHMLNLACVQHRVPLVSGAVIRLDGQLTTYDARQSDSPCYACVFPPDQAPEEISCATMGVLAPLVGVIGSLQAAEALKLMTGIGSSLVGRLQMLDGRSLAWTEMRLRRHANCPVCSSDRRS
ncbi:MAG: molybdopterin-synthase adenylyltransferase MoeB [Betaproteobacteria bacterium]|nr:molybdopterin-synthase adenylyltransferase MoeB [Betaproteobacteria bacterium]